MKGKSLKVYYSEVIENIVTAVKVSGEIVEDMEFEFVKVRTFELINLRVVHILNEMNNKNASTLTRGLLKLFPENVNNEEELVDALVYYHQEEKLAIRKFRHSDKKDIKHMKIEDMFNKVVENTGKVVK